jgi:hypothetical protein
MILIIGNNKIVGTATDGYEGPMQFIAAPEDFDILRINEYVIVDNEAVLPWIKINKDTAKQLLADTDWTATVDISNPGYSNPYLKNQDEFLAYRSTVRGVAVNPPSTEYVFSPPPTAQWASASSAEE